jgi:SAM-dependent methyltransferase
LDVGCGKGKYREEINRRGQYVGLDFDASLNPEFVCNFNNEPFPFPDGSFDFVFSDSVMEHLLNPVAVMDEIYRVMKEGGRGYILVPFHYKAHGSPYDFFRFSKGGVHLLLRKFTDIEIYPIGGSLSVICHIFWNYGRLFDRISNLLGNIYRALIWCIFKLLNPLDRFDPYKIFTRGHNAFFRKSMVPAQNEQ